ncbi:CPBP family glutamic-type intramembrane protease [Candidatus Harpocratesius sp.]
MSHDKTPENLTNSSTNTDQNHINEKNISQISSDIQSDTFYCGKCNKEMRFSDHPKFCINCGTPFVFDVHGQILLDKNRHSYIKPQNPSMQFDQITPKSDSYSNYPSPNQTSSLPEVYQTNATPYINVPSNMYSGKKHWRKRRNWNVLAGIFLPFITYIGIMIISVIILIPVVFIRGLEFLSNRSQWWDFIISAFSILFFIVPYFWIKRYYPGKLTKKQRLAELGLDFTKYSKPELYREIILGIFLGFFGVLIVIGLQVVGGWLVKWLFNINMEMLSQSDSFSQFNPTVPQSLGQLLLFVATMVFFVGVPEEVLFRGFVQRSFESKLNKPAALLLTAVYFSLYHIYIYILVPPLFFYLSVSYLGLSIYLGLIRNWRDDIIAASILHMVYNSTQIIIIFLIFAN